MKKIAWIGHFINETDRELFFNDAIQDSGKNRIDKFNDVNPYVFADILNEKKEVEIASVLLLEYLLKVCSA